MAVDEARQDQSLADVADREAGMPPRHLVEGAEIGNAPIVDHQQTVGLEAGGRLFVANMLPGIVDEVKERAADADARHGLHVVASARPRPDRPSASAASRCC